MSDPTLGDRISEGTAIHTGRMDDCPWGILVVASDEGKTWCSECSAIGKPPSPVFDHASVTELANLATQVSTPSTRRTEDISAYIMKYQLDLGLSNWALFVGEKWPEDNKTDDAFVVRQPAELHAIIHVHPDQPDGQVERLVVHEMLHLAHIRLDELCNNGQSVGVIEAYDRELELFINTLSSAITGIVWEPVGEWAERFEVEQTVS